MKNLTYCFILFLFSQICFPQSEPFFKDYSWEANPTYEVDNNTNESIIAIKDKIVTEFYFLDSNSLVEYFLEHRILWLNSDDKIEEYNKIYLPYDTASQLEVTKARVITKEGKIRELNESKLLSAQDEETGRHYKYFALEGIEKGSFIEYYYVLKKYPAYRGKKINLQSNMKKKNVEFDVFAPSNLVFKFKSYNGLPELELDTLNTDKLHWKLHLDNLEPLEDEEVSAYEASRASVIYKLDRNTATNASDISSYNTVAQNIYSFYYPEHPKNTQKLIDKFISEAVPNPKADEETVLRKLEYYIKTNIYVSEADGDELENLEMVLKNRVANETGAMHLYISALRTLNIKHEIVLTSDRQNLKFDKSFEANNFLTDVLIYFPNNKTYLSPSKLESRYGFPPAFLTDNYGLFIKEVVVGSFKSGIGKVVYINPVKAEKTFDNMIIDVAFDKDDLTKNIIKLDRSLNGYYAMNIHPFLNLVKQEDKDELIDNFAKSMNEDIEVVNKKMVNEDPELFGIKPLQFIIDIKSEAFVEKAGNKYLFKVGELIGRQMEMYQDKERKLPVENEYERSYFRTINIKIPEGYKVANLDDIIINNSYVKNDEEVLSFKSSYKIQDNTIHITADEHYKINIIELNHYEAYRKVINSAADFNKVTLVLEPIK